MSKIYDKLYEAAKLDGESVKILNKNSLRAPAIYHCAQAVEKCSKSIHAYYMINFQNKKENEIGYQLGKSYGHELKKSTRAIIETLMRLYVNNEIKNNPKLKRKGEQTFKDLVNANNSALVEILDVDEIIVGFNQLSDRMYNVYKHVQSISNGYYSPSNQIDKLIKKYMTGPGDKYYWYIFLAMLLSSFLDKLEIYSRYPMFELSNNNITILNNYRNKFAINRISELISEMIKLVPIVWNKIDYFKSSLRRRKLKSKTLTI